VALARGMASELNYRVTICTEEAWKDFVVSKCADVTAGEVHFLPSGGDTALQTSGYVEQAAMSTKTEVMQVIMARPPRSDRVGPALRVGLPH